MKLALIQRTGEVFHKMDGPQSIMVNSLLVAVLSVIDSAARSEELRELQPFGRHHY